jgi:tetratricopeptide (TPR) repeat protein
MLGARYIMTSTDSSVHAPRRARSGSGARAKSGLALTAACALALALLPSTHVAAQSTHHHARTPAPQPAESQEPEEGILAARGLFDAGSVAFRQGRYEDALSSFEQAHRLTKDPVLLFSIGMTLDRLRRDADAVHAFEAYVAALPDAPNRAVADERIRVLKEHMVQQPPPAPVAVAPEPAPAPVVSAPPPEHKDEPRGLRVLPQWAFWTGAGITVALGAVTVWSGIDKLNAHDAYVDKPTQQGLDDGERTVVRTNAFGATTAVVGAASAVIGIFFTDWQGRGKETAARKHLRWTANADAKSLGVGMLGRF